MKKVTKTIICTCLGLFYLLLIENYSAAQDGEAQGVQMEDGWKVKTVKNKNIELSAEFSVNEAENGGGLTFGLENETTVTHWCKNRRNKKCPRAYFNVD